MDHKIVKLTSEDGSSIYVDPRKVVKLHMGGTGITVMSTSDGYVHTMSGDVDTLAKLLWPEAYGVEEVKESTNDQH